MRNLKIIILFFVITTTAFNAWAEEVTPSHVFQVTENIKNSVNHIYHKTGKPIPKVSVSLQERQPRHVLYKAHDVLLKIHRIKQLHNMEYEELEILPVRNVTPRDVKFIVDRILNEIKGVYPLFSVDDYKSDGSSFVADKKPTDVYRNLIFVSTSLDGLMGGVTLPKNVYRMAVILVSDIKEIRRVQGITIPIKSIILNKNITPTDVYNNAYTLLERVKLFDEKHEYKVSGGVLLPNKTQNRKIPEDVKNILNQVLAEVGAIKFTLKLNKPSIIPPAGTIKTPSEVYKQISKAIAYMDTLL